jgi:F-type H+-transporting ATPase subunit gamma
MPSLIDIRRRLRAVKSTQQITKAMKMVAASRLRRSQEAILNARPFALQLSRVLNSLATRVDPNAHPLLAQPEGGEDAPTLVIIITADKGMAGSFNANIIRAAGNFVAERPARSLKMVLVGRKGADFFRRRGFPVLYEVVNIFTRLDYNDARIIAKVAMEAFVGGQVERVVIAYNEFKSVLQQRVVIQPLLPIPHGDLDEGDATALVDYLYEPSPQAIFDALLPRHVEFQVYRALLESVAAENAAKMVAMDNATKNSAEVIDNLTLYINKLRQAAITREIIEVVSGAQAL